jgi:flagellar motor switch protein FliM
MTEVLSQDEIDQLLTAINAGETEPEDFRPAADTRKIKIYDFKRPDKFSKEQIRTVSIMHETFARLTTTSLSANLRSMVHVHVASVDQLTYEEFIRSIPTPTTLAIINMDPLKGNAILEIDPAVTFSIIERLFGGKTEGTKVQTHELTDIEQSVMEGIIVRILGNMREAWATVIDLRPRLGQIDTNPQFAQIVPPTEMVVLVTLETKVGEVEGMMNFCIPYLTIEPIIGKLSAQFWYSSVRRGTTTENLNVLKEKLATVDVNVVAEIGKIQIPVRDVLALRVGDVIRLYNVRVGDTFSLNIGSKKKFLCRPGVIGKKMAVQILKKTAELEQEEFEELASEGEEML